MKRLIALLASVALAFTVMSAMTPDRSDAAGSLASVSASLWNPGNIISDANFYDGGAYNASQIQDFLQQKVTSCAAGYTCLRNYRQSTPTMAPSALCPGGYAGSGDERSSDIIAKVGSACNISQKVLLVLLEKEQSLVTMRSPGAGRFAAATGFGCPDTAPCDPAFAGFFYQVYYAARQFQNYAQNPTRWNYQAGRVNHILYNPNRHCGTSPVYIQNKATAGLYIYTPYQPNASALANLYGTGDGCATYGNRNFWRIYSDWFGNPISASSLMRTPENSSVYLVSGDYKYPITSLAILSSLAPLGVVGYVSQNYLDGLTTGHAVGKSLRAPDGSIYFYDSGMKLPFTSCEQAVDYGASCEPSGYVQLTEAQIASFVTGPTLTSVMGTTEGARYYIKNGTRVEILDSQSQQDAGIPAGMNVLTENAVSHLPLGTPIVRDGVFVLARGTANYVLLSGASRYALAAGDAASFGVSSRTAGTLWSASLDKLLANPTKFAGLVTAGGTTALLGSGGRYSLAGGAVPANLTPIPVAQSFLDSYPVAGALADGSFIKAPNLASVYIVMTTDIRPVTSWGALVALTTNGQPQIVTVPQAFIEQLTKGVIALTAGTLVRSPENATIWFIDGVSSRIALSSFEFTNEAGITGWRYAPEGIIQGYPANPDLMSFGWACGDQRYVSAAGSLHLVDPSLMSSWPFKYVTIDRFTCQQLKKGAPATQYIRTWDGSIYKLVDGQKLPITSMARFIQLNPAQNYTTVATYVANWFPTGPVA